MTTASPAAGHSPVGRAVRILWLLAVAGVAVLVLTDRWSEVAPVLADLRNTPLLLGAVAGLAAVGFSGGMWRAVLAGLGAPLGTAAVTTVFFITQLGKYLPGAVWPLLAQMDLARDYGVRPRVSAAGLVLFTWVHVVTGLAVALVALPLGGILPPATVVLGIAALVLLVPGPLGVVMDAGLRIVRRAPLPQRPELSAMVRAAAWAGGMWLAFGVHLSLLALAAGEGLGLVHAAGAFAGAWVVGFAVLVAPAGAGAREAALATVLAGPLGTGPALAVTLVSRLLLVVADAAWASAGIVVRRRAG